MSRALTLFIISALLSACASVHPGIKGISSSAQQILPLNVSAENIEADSNEAFQLIEVTLENPSDKWLKINSAKYLIQDPSKMSVVLGQDLKDWAQAMIAKKKVEQQNKEMIQLGLMGIGAAAAIAGSSSNNSDLAGLGGVVMAGASGWVLADTISTSVDSANQSKKVPENHLYHPVSVPPKSFVRRWILVNKPSDMVIKVMRLEFETIEGEKETYAFNF